MKIFKHPNFWTIVLLFMFGFSLFWLAIGDELWYLRHCEYKDFTIEVELMTGTKTTVKRRLPKESVFFISCSHTCQLMWTIPSSKLILGGHSSSVRDGVINYQILE